MAGEDWDVTGMANARLFMLEEVDAHTYSCLPRFRICKG